MCSQFHRFPSGRNPLLSILCNLLGFVFVFVRHSSNHSLVLSEQSRFCRDLNDVTLVETSLLGVGVSCWQNMQDRLKLWQMAKVVEIFLQLPKYQNCWQPVGLGAESARAVTGRRCPHSGKGEDFLTGQPDFFTETAVTPERKVENSFPRSEINRHAEG